MIVIRGYTYEESGDHCREEPGRVEDRDWFHVLQETYGH